MLIFNSDDGFDMMRKQEILECDKEESKRKISLLSQKRFSSSTKDGSTQLAFQPNLKEQDQSSDIIQEILTDQSQSEGVEDGERKISVISIQQNYPDQPRLRSQTNFNQKKKKKKSAKRQSINETKVKTELCKNWSEKGKCNYGKKCKFAHGKLDMVQKLEDNLKYRSKYCKSFTQNMCCNYGHRCQFIHESRSVSQILSDYNYQSIVNRLDLAEQSTKLDQIQRCQSLIFLGLIQQTIRSKSSPNFNSNSIEKQNNFVDRIILQRWINKVQKGVLIAMHQTSSSEDSIKLNSNNSYQYLPDYL